MLSSAELMELPKASEIKFIFVCGSSSGVGCGGDGREHKKYLNIFFLFNFMLSPLSINNTNFSKAPVKIMMTIFHHKNPTQKKSL